MRIPNWFKELQLLDVDYSKGIYSRGEYLSRRAYLRELAEGRVKLGDVYIEPIILEEGHEEQDACTQ